MVSLGEVLSQTSPDSIEPQNRSGEVDPQWRRHYRKQYWQQFWHQSGISPLHRDAVGRRLDTRGGALDPVAERVVAFCRQDQLRGGVYLHGGVGCGKTLIAAKMLYCLALDRSKRLDDLDLWVGPTEPRELKLISTPRLLADIRATFHSDESSAAIVDEYRFADVVVIDDIGAEKPSEWVCDTLFQIVDWRYGRNAPTIFTSNCSLRELGERLSERIADRILEMCQGNIIEIRCGSYRGMVGE
jgi:DNA replication protein DnaC